MYSTEKKRLADCKKPRNIKLSGTIKIKYERENECRLYARNNHIREYNNQNRSNHSATFSLLLILIQFRFA